MGQSAIQVQGRDPSLWFLDPEDPFFPPLQVKPGPLSGYAMDKVRQRFPVFCAGSWLLNDTPEELSTQCQYIGRGMGSYSIYCVFPVVIVTFSAISHFHLIFHFEFFPPSTVSVRMIMQS